MQDKDSQLIKDATLVTVDYVVSLVPGLPLSWALFKSLCGVGIKLREKKILEFVENIKEHPEVFTKQILESEEFQDCFVFALQKYVIERKKEKRKIMRDIFLGFAEDDNKREYELERFYHVLNVLNKSDINVLGDNRLLGNHDYIQINDKSSQRAESIHFLISLGVLFTDSGARIAGESLVLSPYVKLSEFGRKLIRFLCDDHE